MMVLLCALLLLGGLLGSPGVAHATNAQQIDFLLSGYKNATGTVLTGGLVYTYSAGTTTAKTCWTDATKSSEAANPFVLDTYGRGTLYCDGNYKFVVKTSAGVTVSTLDNMYYAVPGADISATLIVSESTSMTSTYQSYYCTAAGGAVTLDMPDCTSNTGLRFKVVKTDSSANACTLDGYGAQTINGSTTKALSSQYDSVDVECDGTGWYILSQSTLADAGTLDTYDTALANVTGSATRIIPAINTTGLDKSYPVGSIKDQSGGVNLMIANVPTGVWDMDASADGSTTLSVAHGITNGIGNIVGVDCMIWDDTYLEGGGGVPYKVPYMDSDFTVELAFGQESTQPEAGGHWDATNIYLMHSGAATEFDSAAFDNDAANRGRCLIIYK